MLWALELSFTSYDMVSAPAYVGLENYRNLAADPIFRETLVNTLVYIGGSTVLITLVGPRSRARHQYRVPGARYCMMAMFLTNLMPIIAVCLVWRFLLHPYGLVNQLLSPLGVGRIDWLTSSSTRRCRRSSWSLSGASRPTSWWCSSPACWPSPTTTTRRRISTAPTALQRFRHITLPLLMPIIVLRRRGVGAA